MKNLFILTIIFLFTQCEPIPSQSIGQEKQMVYDNYNYEDLVGAVQIIPFKGQEASILENPIIGINDNQSLNLTFDLITENFEYLGVKIYHCNRNWQKSMLRDMEFIDDINTFRITDFDFSLNTNTPYINYRFEIPKPSISGNYIVSVFRRGNPKDILFNRKFMVVHNKSSIEQLVRVSTTVSKRDENQQIDFKVNYGNIQVNNPTQDITIVLLQNHRWQDARMNLTPSLIRPNDNYMEYRLLNLENNFPGWNEFRFFDIRTLNVTGRNVQNISTPTNGTTNVLLGVDSQRGIVYTQNLRDINGNFIIQNTDPGDVPLNADYANVTFILKSDEYNGRVYVGGRFNNWNLTDENVMKYNSSNGTYQTTIFLKQGYYDYHYVVDAIDTAPYELERSHFQTENDYEIFIYYRKPGNINDELIGYKKFNSRANN
jgi:hypothetical protein